MSAGLDEWLLFMEEVEFIKTRFNPRVVFVDDAEKRRAKIIARPILRQNWSGAAKRCLREQMPGIVEAIVKWSDMDLSERAHASATQYKKAGGFAGCTCCYLYENDFNLTTFYIGERPFLFGMTAEEPDSLFSVWVHAWEGLAKTEGAKDPRITAAIA